MRPGPHRWQALAFPDSELRQLYEQACSEHWRVAELDWAALPLEHIGAPTRVPLAALYTDVAFAEAIGVRALQQVTERAPAGFLRDFALTQLADEREHALFFSLLAEQLGAPATVSPFLMELSEELRTVSAPDQLLLHLHVVERTLQALFFASSERALATLLGDPRRTQLALPARDAVIVLLRWVVERVGRDEARHVAFGTRYLQHCLAACGTAERSKLAQHASTSAELLYRAFELRSEAFRGLVLHPPALLQQAFGVVKQELAPLGLELEVPALRRT